MCCCFYFFATAPLHCCSLGSKIPARRLAPCYQSLSGTYSISANEGNLKHWSDYMNRVRLCWAWAACCWPWYSLLWTLPKYTVKRLILQINRYSRSENQCDARKQNLLVLSCVASGILVRWVLSSRRSRQGKPAAKPKGKIPPATFLMSFECRPLLTP